MRLLVDGDGCPVKQEVIQVAKDKQLPVIIVTTYDHYQVIEEDHVEMLILDQGFDAVDYCLMALVQPEDIVITQDYGLASLVLSKGGRVIHHTGLVYTTKNIDQLLIERHLNQHQRRQKGRIKGPSKFTKQQRSQFINQLIQLIDDTNHNSL